MQYTNDVVGHFWIFWEALGTRESLNTWTCKLLGFWRNLSHALITGQTEWEKVWVCVHICIHIYIICMHNVYIYAYTYTLYVYTMYTYIHVYTHTQICSAYNIARESITVTRINSEYCIYPVYMQCCDICNESCRQQEEKTQLETVLSF